jgi:putative ABC transport system permease protein
VTATIDAMPRAADEVARLAPGYDVDDVCKARPARLRDAEVIVGAVSLVMLAQTLDSHTAEHINASAALRALGAFSGFMRRAILKHAVLSVPMGYLMGVPPSVLVICLSRDSTPLIVMTTNLAHLLPALIVGMCVFAAISAIKITRIDPAAVLSR